MDIDEYIHLYPSKSRENTSAVWRIESGLRFVSEKVFERFSILQYSAAYSKGNSIKINADNNKHICTKYDKSGQLLNNDKEIAE